MTANSTTLLNDVDIEAVGGLIQAVSDDPARAATRWRWAHPARTCWARWS